MKITHVNYEIFTKGRRQYPGDNVKLQIDVKGGWVGLKITPLAHYRAMTCPHFSKRGTHSLPHLTLSKWMGGSEI